MAKNPRYRPDPSAGYALNIIFETAALREAFIGWYLDGGGDEGFLDTCENEGLGSPEMVPAHGQQNWPWGDVIGAEPNYTVAVKVDADE